MRDQPLPREHIPTDKNASLLAGHHSIGADRYQIAPGNHRHKADEWGSVPAFDHINVTIDPNDLDDQLKKIWDIIIQGGGTITFPVPSAVYYHSFTTTSSDQPSDEEYTLEYSGTLRIFTMCIDRWIATNIHDWASGETFDAGPVVISQEFWEDFGDFYGAAGAFMVDAEGPHTASHYYSSPTFDGALFAFASNIFTAITSLDVYAESWYFDNLFNGDVNYQISSAPVVNAGAPQQFTLIKVEKLSEITNIGDIVLNGPPAENILESFVQAYEPGGFALTSSGFWIIENWAGPISWNEPVSSVIVATFGMA